MRQKRSTALIVLSLSALLAGLHFLAITFSLYWQLWWFDVPMHFLGGFVVGLFGLSFSGPPAPLALNNRRLLAVAVLAALIAGAGWEMFEYLTDIRFDAIGNYPLDTAKDLTLDLIGGLIAYLYFVSPKSSMRAAKNDL